MAKKSGTKVKDVEYWQKIASYLAVALALTILGGGIHSSWISSQNRALEAFKESNKGLKASNNTVTEKLMTSTNELEKYKAINKKLEEALLQLKVENASLKTLAD